MSSPLVTAAMTWLGPQLGEDDQDLLRLFDSVALGRGTVLADDPELVGELRDALVELEVWTLGADEEHGGGGAGRTTTVVAWERLGRYWPALAWASIQVHAALKALERHADDLGELMGALHAGRAGIAAVETARPSASLEWSETSVSGRVLRADAASVSPYLLLLDGARVVLVRPEACRYAEVGRTGLAGALTRAVEVDAVLGETAIELRADAAAVRDVLRLGAAAVAAGIAGAAADTAAQYARERHQFGGPLAEIPTVARSLRDQRDAVRATLSGLWASDVPSGAAIARAALHGAVDVAAAALQTHGGYGYLTEYPVERYVRDAVSLRAAASLVANPSEDL